MNVAVEYIETEWEGWLYPNGSIDFLCNHPSTESVEIDYGGLHHDSRGDLDWFDDIRIEQECLDCGEVLEQDDDEPDWSRDE